MKIVFRLLCSLAVIAAVSCKDDNPGGSTKTDEPMKVVRLARPAWYDNNPVEDGTAKYSVGTDPIRLEFFGWGESTDKTFTLDFPDDPSPYNRVILTYRMGGWNQGPSEWDNTTMFFVRNKQDNQWYEIARAFTPYGGGFGADWHKEFYLDVTEFLPMLRGETEFRAYYGGFDANDMRAHTVTLTFDLCEGASERKCVWTAKAYDTSRDGNTGYRAWAYGCAGYDIEAPERLGARTFDLPAEVRTVGMRVAISGHGHDQGKFPDRPNYRTKNAAEFDINTYEIKLNGEAEGVVGNIFYSNVDNYPQAGTYQYDRANWGPGNPLYTHYWEIQNLPESGGELTLDFDLERFNSAMKEPNAEGIAQYIIEVDLFGYDR